MRRPFIAGWLCAAALGIVGGGCAHAPLAPSPADPLAAARELTKKGNPQEALERFEVILAREPGLLGAHRGYVEAAYYSGKIAAAELRYQRLAAQPDRAGIGHYGLGLIWIAKGPGHMSEALAELSLAEGLLPREGDVPNRIGIVHLMNGDAARAATEFAKALALSPDDPGIRVAYASALVTLGRPQEAIEILRRALTLSPSAEQAERARTLTARIFDPLRDVPPDLAPDLQRAIDLLDRENVQMALSVVHQVLAQNPKVALGLCLKGLAHSRLENNAEAIVAFQEALALQPQSPMALIGLGDVYARLERWQQARECYEKAIELDPFDREAYLRMGEMANLRKDPEAAAVAFATLAQLDPRELAYRRQWALALVAADRLEEALAVYEGSLAQHPRDEDSLVRAGSLHLTLAEREPARRAEHLLRARKLLTQAHDLNPENQSVTQMLEKLEE